MKLKDLYEYFREKGLDSIEDEMSTWGTPGEDDYVEVWAPGMVSDTYESGAGAVYGEFSVPAKGDSKESISKFLGETIADYEKAEWETFNEYKKGYIGALKEVAEKLEEVDEA